MTKLRQAADLTITAINGIFGTNLTTGEVLIGATLLRLTGGFQLLRTAVFTAINAISILSTALISTPAGRVILGIVLAAEGLIAVWDREKSKQQGWIASADAHKTALEQLKAAVDAVKAGVPGADEALKQLAKTNLAAADAAQLASEARVKQMQDVLDAMKAGGEFNAPLGADIETQTEALVRAQIDLAKSARQLKEVHDTIDGKVVGNIEDLRTTAEAGAAGVKNLGTAADAAAGKVENLDHQITVIRGGGAGGQITKEVFDVVDGVARRADQSKAALDGVADSAKSAADRVKNVSNEVTNSIAAVPDAIKPDAATSAVDGIVTDVNKIAPAAQEAADGTNTALSTIDAGSAAHAADAVVTPFESLPGKIGAILSGLQGLIQGGFSSLAATVNSLASQIDAAIQRILSALREAVAAAQSLRSQAASASASSGGGSHGGFAGGGAVYGAGGPRDDSILAWLSNGEFVIQAAAVQRLGVDFFHMLNNGFLPSLKGLHGFSLGGAVDNFSRSMSVPRFAGGGLAQVASANATSQSNTSDRMVHLKMDFGLGVNDVIDMITPDYVVNKLQRVAIKHSYLSTGRAPSRGK